MATIIFILIILALFHFIYDSILLPNIRLSIRYKLFEQRDNLRNYHMENPNKISEDMFMKLDGSISNVIKYLPVFNLSFMVNFVIHIANEANQTTENTTMDTSIKSIMEKDEKINSILNHSYKYIFITILANAFSWVIVLLPIVIFVLIAAFCLQKVNSLYASIRNMINIIFFSSEGQVKDYMKYDNTDLSYC